MTTSPTRSACPGFSVTSRALPLRLFSRPSTATRCAIGVVPRAISGLGVTSTVTMSAGPCPRSSAVSPLVFTGWSLAGCAGTIA